jgi:predicted nucleic acid-binding protein
MTDEIARRAIQVQGKLAYRGQHRSVSIPDLIVAATAERFSLAVLHYDADYDRIAEVTGQPAEWVVPRGTADKDR